MLGNFAGRQVAVVGMGKSNQSLCRYLVREGASITCFDRKTPVELGRAYHELRSLGVGWSLGERYLDTLPGYPWIFLTPGMKKHLPQIVEARVRGAVISNETALFLERCKAAVSAVTGSAGKTTTCTLVGRMLRESLPETPVYVGGNIGTVLIEEVDSIAEESLVVLELSSFQLELLTKSPEASLVLNLQPNHLDIHESYRDYVEAKKRVFRFQKGQDWCVLNLDDPVTCGMSRECPGKVAYFTVDPRRAGEALGRGFPVTWLEGDDLVMACPSGEVPGYGRDPSKIAGAGDLLIPGRHNVSNALGAAMLAAIVGGTPEGMRQGIRSFAGVPHRIEFVAEIGSVRYYNDSIATSPDRTMALLEAVSGPLVVIMGGYDKGIPFDDLAARLVARGCAVVTLGNTAPKIERALQDAWLAAEPTGGAGPRAPLNVTRAASLEEAVRTASSKAVPGGSVALSPACASFDMFADFEERGLRFKELVRGLL